MSHASELTATKMNTVQDPPLKERISLEPAGTTTSGRDFVATTEPPPKSGIQAINKQKKHKKKQEEKRASASAAIPHPERGASVAKVRFFAARSARGGYRCTRDQVWQERAERRGRGKFKTLSNCRFFIGRNFNCLI
jgi:hypothetical protein